MSSSSSSETTQEKRKEAEKKQKEKEKELLKLSNEDRSSGLLFYETINKLHWKHALIVNANSTKYLIEEMS